MHPQCLLCLWWCHMLHSGWHRFHPSRSHLTICLFLFYHLALLRSNVSLHIASIALLVYTLANKHTHTHTVAADLPRKLNKGAFHQVGSCPETAGMGHTSGFQMSCMLNKAWRLLLQLLFSFFSLNAWRLALPELFQNGGIVCVCVSMCFFFYIKDIKHEGLTEQVMIEGISLLKVCFLTVYF